MANELNLNKEVNIGNGRKISVRDLLGIAEAGALRIAPDPTMEKIGEIVVGFCAKGKEQGWNTKTLIEQIREGLPGSSVETVYTHDCSSTSLFFSAPGDTDLPRCLKVGHGGKNFLVPWISNSQRCETYAGFNYPDEPGKLKVFTPAILKEVDRGWKVVLPGQLGGVCPTGFSKEAAGPS